MACERNLCRKPTRATVATRFGHLRRETVPRHEKTRRVVSVRAVETDWHAYLGERIVWASYVTAALSVGRDIAQPVENSTVAPHSGSRSPRRWFHWPSGALLRSWAARSVTTNSATVGRPPGPTRPRKRIRSRSSRSRPADQRAACRRSEPVAHYPATDHQEPPRASQDASGFPRLPHASHSLFALWAAPSFSTLKLLATRTLHRRQPGRPGHRAQRS